MANVSNLVPARCGPGSGTVSCWLPPRWPAPNRTRRRIPNACPYRESTPPAIDASEVPEPGQDPPGPAARARQADGRRRALGLRRHHRARHPAAAQRRLGRGMAGRRPRHRRCHRRQGPTRQAPAREHHQGPRRDAGHQGPADPQGRGGHRRGRRQGRHQGRRRRERLLLDQRPAARPADVLGQRRRARAGDAARRDGRHARQDQRAGGQARRPRHPGRDAVGPRRPRHEHIGLRHRPVLPIRLAEPDFRRHRLHPQPSTSPAAATSAIRSRTTTNCSPTTPARSAARPDTPTTRARRSSARPTATAAGWSPC